MAASATLALKPGVWFRRGRLLIVSPDSLGTACPLSGRNSTYRLVQILEAGSVCHDGSYRFWEWDDEECDFTPLAIIALPLPVSNPATDG